MRDFQWRAFTFVLGTSLGFFVSHLLQNSDHPKWFSEPKNMHEVSIENKTQPQSLTDSQDPPVTDTDSTSQNSASSMQNLSGKIASRNLDSVKEDTKDNSLLQAPGFTHKGAFQNDINGGVYAVWTKSKGAMSYEVKIFDAQEKEVKSFVSESNRTVIKDLYINPKLKATKYKMQVVPLGENGERGEPSNFKEIAMLPMRNLAPPTIKSITTEE